MTYWDNNGAAIESQMLSLACAFLEYETSKYQLIGLDQVAMFADRFVVNQLKRTDEMTMSCLQLVSANPK